MNKKVIWIGSAVLAVLLAGVILFVVFKKTAGNKKDITTIESDDGNWTNIYDAQPVG